MKVATIAPLRSENPGIVPPWLQKPDPTPPTQTAGNGGIVPPWLENPIRILPWPWPEDEWHIWSNN
jgi:hypothetical protein